MLHNTAIMLHNMTVALSELADEDWIVPSAEGFIVQACRDAGFEPRVVSVTSDPLAMRGLVAQGLAVAMVPSLLSQAYAGVALRPLDGDVPRRDVFALLPPGGRHPLAEEVVTALADAAAGF
jgi:DNA-binding transcriptional LysR family regulator